MKLAVHEKILFTLFSKNEKLTIFDVGGCEGLSSVRYMDLFPNTTAFIFEPLPKNIEKIKVNKQKHQLKNLEIISSGLSSEIGEASFYISSGQPSKNKNPKDESTDFGNKSSSLLAPHLTKQVHPWLKFKEQITIPITTLNAFCTSKKITTIDFLHMDVQGAELKVLEGSSTMLSNIKSIWLEVERIPLYKDQALQKDIEQFLTKNNFTCILNKVNYVSGDQFWVQKNYFKKLSFSKRLQLNTKKHLYNFKSSFKIFVGAIKYSIKPLKSN